MHKKLSAFYSLGKQTYTPHPGVYLQSYCLPLHTEHKFLGLILGAELTFVPHIKYLKNKRCNTINNVKLLSRTTWVRDTKYTCTHLNNRAIIYQSASPSVLTIVQPVLP